jgi:glycine/D-amino acid oxidase-like deaminating enzyme
MHVAVLGAGIMGCSAALALARRGARVTLLDAAPQPCLGASRWNEGKIHLGYLYAADPSLATARVVLDGGLAFKPLIERLIDRSIDGVTSPVDDVYLVHRRSVVDADAMGRYYAAVSALVRGHPGAARYLSPAGGADAHRLSAAELGQICDTPDIVAGFRVPERSVSTLWIADLLVAAVAAEPRIEARWGLRVSGVSRHETGADAPVHVATSDGLDGPYDAVVNALWDGRLGVDAARGLPPPPAWSHRFRRSLFVRTSRPVTLPSAVIAVGPYGDVKNYNGRDLYLSWYPAGLAVEGTGLEPPPVPPLDDVARARLIETVLDRLGAMLPSVAALRPVLASVQVEGGWVYAAGRGALDDRRSTLHRRDRAGILRDGRYLSIDTGKYSMAPWIAERLAGELLGAAAAGGPAVIGLP